jgi:hypothetical protein
MNSIDDQMAGFGNALWIGILGAVGIYFLRVILTMILRRKVAPELVPGLSAEDSQTAMPRFLSMIGVGARPASTFGTFRLTTSLGIKILWWAGLAALVYFARQMQARVIGPESLIIVMVAVQAVQSQFYEIEYDAKTVSLPRWWFGKTVQPWRKLVAVTDKDPYFYTFHFADQSKVRVYKYIVGHDEFMKVARNAVRDA